MSDARGDSVAVRAVDVHKRFVAKGWNPRRPKAAVHALRGASLEVQRGSIHGVMGPNGSGKTTLLRVLATLVIADSGDAEVNGFDVQARADGVRKSIGISTGEERSVYWRLTARQNLEFAAALYKLGKPADVIAEALELVALSEDADRPVSGYSQGMVRRLGLARAVLHRPRILLLDEPTRSLDPDATEEFHVLLKKLQDDGVTTLLTTHDVGEALTICDRVSVLREGVFVEHTTPVDAAQLTAALHGAHP